MKIDLAGVKAAAIADLAPDDPLRILVTSLSDEVTPEAYLQISSTIRRLATKTIERSA